MAIPFGNAALASARALADQQDPANIDAATILDTQSNLGAVSQNNAQTAGENAVKAKPPKIEISIGPNGEQVINAKNLPVKSQIQQVRDAQAKPYQSFADQLQATVEQATRVAGASPDPENVDGTPEQLAHELGVDKPVLRLQRGGLGEYLADSSKYSHLLSDPNRLKQLVAAQRLKNKLGILGEGAKAEGDLKTLQQIDTAGEREGRLEKASASTQLLSALEHMDLAGTFKSPDEAVKTLGPLYAAAGDAAEPVIRGVFAKQVYDRSQNDLDNAIKVAREKRQDALARQLEGLRDIMISQKTQAQSPKDITPNTREFRVAQDLAYGNLTFPQFRSLYSYSRDVNTKLAIYDKAAELNPNFNPAQFELGYKIAGNPKIRQQVAASDNALGMLDEATKISDAATRAGAPALNRFIVKGGFEVGGKRYSDFRALQLALADEISGALGFGSATDMTRQLGLNMTDPNMSPAQFKSAVNNVVRPFLEQKRRTLINQMGVYGPGVNSMSGQPQTSAPGSIDPDAIRRQIEQNRKKGRRP